VDQRQEEADGEHQPRHDEDDAQGRREASTDAFAEDRGPALARGGAGNLAVCDALG
jgi:hypothetical protein